VLNQWFGANRWTYNQAVDGIINSGIGPYKDYLREYCVNSKAFKQGGAMAGKVRKGRRKTGP
jgi:hypothetical protein